ncbi:MAG: DUF4391 domain-containing protein, partial [Christensenellaceae bacterium]
FDEQISRLSIVAEISPQTVALAAGPDVSAVYVILIALKTEECDQQNIALLSKLIDQHMLFILQYGNTARLTVYRSGKVLVSGSKPAEEWKLSLSGLDLGAVWDNIIAEIGGIDLTGGKDLDAAIAENDRRVKLAKQIAALEKKAMSEKQPRRKWEYAEEIRQLKLELED